MFLIKIVFLEFEKANACDYRSQNVAEIGAAAYTLLNYNKKIFEDDLRKKKKCFCFFRKWEIKLTFLLTSIFSLPSGVY